jgi:hypothetical protein
MNGKLYAAKYVIPVEEIGAFSKITRLCVRVLFDLV